MTLQKIRLICQYKIPNFDWQPEDVGLEDAVRRPVRRPTNISTNSHSVLSGLNGLLNGWGDLVSSLALVSIPVGRQYPGPARHGTGSCSSEALLYISGVTGDCVVVAKDKEQSGRHKRRRVV